MSNNPYVAVGCIAAGALAGFFASRAMLGKDAASAVTASTRPANQLPLIRVMPSEGADIEGKTLIMIPGNILVDAIVWRPGGEVAMAPNDVALPDYAEIENRINILSRWWDGVDKEVHIAPGGSEFELTAAGGMLAIGIYGMPIVSKNASAINIRAYIPFGSDVSAYLTQAPIVWDSLQAHKGQFNTITDSEAAMITIASIATKLDE